MVTMEIVDCYFVPCHLQSVISTGAKVLLNVLVHYRAGNFGEFPPHFILKIFGEGIKVVMHVIQWHQLVWRHWLFLKIHSWLFACYFFFPCYFWQITSNQSTIFRNNILLMTRDILPVISKIVNSRQSGPSKGTHLIVAVGALACTHCFSTLPRNYTYMHTTFSALPRSHIYTCTHAI